MSVVRLCDSVSRVAKDKEVVLLLDQVEKLSDQCDHSASVNDKELFRLQSQLNELQRQHTDVLEQNDLTVKLKDDEMKKLYAEIGTTALGHLISDLLSSGNL